MKIKAVIFDLDGTLLNTLEDLCDSVNYALAACSMPQRTLEQVRSFVGNGVRRLVERSVPATASARQTQSCFEVFREHYKTNSRNKTAPYAGVLEMLDEVKGAGIKAAVVTNKSHAEAAALCSEIFGDRLCFTVGAREGFALKPEPDAVLYAMSELGVDGSEAIYVGDSEVDALTAHNSGLAFVGVSWGFRERKILEQNNAEYIIDFPYQLIEIIA